MIFESEKIAGVKKKRERKIIEFFSSIPSGIRMGITKFELIALSRARLLRCRLFNFIPTQ